MYNPILREVARRMYLFLDKIKGGGNRTPETTEKEIQILISEIGEHQKISQDRLDKMLEKTLEIKKVLFEEERMKHIACRNNVAKFLENQGVSREGLDEFLESPSQETIELLKKKYPVID